MARIPEEEEGEFEDVDSGGGVGGREVEETEGSDLAEWAGGEEEEDEMA